MTVRTEGSNEAAADIHTALCACLRGPSAEIAFKHLAPYELQRLGGRLGAYESVHAAVRELTLMELHVSGVSALSCQQRKPFDQRVNEPDAELRNGISVVFHEEQAGLVCPG